MNGVSRIFNNSHPQLRKSSPLQFTGSIQYTIHLFSLDRRRYSPLSLSLCFCLFIVLPFGCIACQHYHQPIYYLTSARYGMIILFDTIYAIHYSFSINNMLVFVKSFVVVVVFFFPVYSCHHEIKLSSTPSAVPILSPSFKMST